jgi:hypothetical protein
MKMDPHLKRCHQVLEFSAVAMETVRRRRGIIIIIIIINNNNNNIQLWLLMKDITELLY